MNALTEARLEAYRRRGEVLLAVSEGRMKPHEVIAMADEPCGEVLRPITLKRLLGALPGWGEAKSGRFISELALVAETTVKPNRLTISWLIDRRAGGRRLVAYANLWQQEHRSERPTPWPGFPYTPLPKGGVL